jgi:hypothetical protein
MMLFLNKNLHSKLVCHTFPTRHCTFLHCISVTPHMSVCVSLSNFIHPTAYISLQELNGPCITLSNIAYHWPHTWVCVCVCVSLSNFIHPDHYISLSNCLLQLSGRGPCVTLTFAHFCIILSIVFFHFPIVFYNILKGHRSLLDNNLWSVLKGPWGMAWA